MRPALNAPVLNVGFLPVGPARAAIVVFAEEWGGMGLALGIRSNEGGQVAVFRNQESIEPDVSIPAALEPALAEAERMGFLFDEEMVESASTSAGQGRAQAMALWGRLMGELDLPPSARIVKTEPAASEPIMDLPDRPAPVVAIPEAPSRLPEAPSPLPELVLDDLATVEMSEITLELEAAPVADASEPAVAADAPLAAEPLVLNELVDEPSVALPRRASTERAAPPKPALSRFRESDPRPSTTRSAGSAAPEGATDSGSQLGRIPLVRVRREGAGPKRVPYLARLLSSF
jgi:hypothetical protein